MERSLPPPRLILPHGVNFRCPQGTQIDGLVRSLQRVAGFLQDLDPYAQLQRFEDWWQHDGLHFYEGKMDMHRLLALVESPRSLLSTMPDDDFVRIGVAPEDYSWYLRMYAGWTGDGWALAGDFDLILPDRLAPRFRDEVVPALEVPVSEQNAHDWYRSIGLRSVGIVNRPDVQSATAESYLREHWRPE